jgi:guanosine-3',5'-bis(diphosphate) 3'-pyrophosphohydrolase
MEAVVAPHPERGSQTFLLGRCDDKSLPKAERKRSQIEHARTASPGAQLIRLADKIGNLRDLDTSPPASWSIERRREYVDWFKSVIDGIRDRHEGSSTLFDRAYTRRP